MFKKIASNTIAQVISKWLTAIISIFLLSFLTNYLSMEWFWVYNKIYNYLGIFAFLADLGLYTIMIRELSQEKESSERIVGNVLTLRWILWISIIFLALGMSFFIPWYNWSLEFYSILIVWIFTAVSLLNSSILALMQSKLKMEFSLISVVSWKIIWLGLIITFFLYYWAEGLSQFDWKELLVIFWIGLLWIAINTFLNYLYARKICPIRFRFDSEYILYIFKISLPYGIALFLSVVYFKIDIILLSILDWESADRSIALYSLPMKIVEVLMVLWGFYLNSLLPKLSSLFEQWETLKLSIDKQSSDQELAGITFQTQHILRVSFNVLFSFGLFIATFGIVFREYLILIIANESYISRTQNLYTSSDALLIVLLILVFYFISLLYIYIFISAKKQWILLKINIFITIFNIVWNIIMIHYLSFIGAAIVTLMSQIFLLLLSWHFSRKIIRVWISKIFISKMLLLSGSCFCLIYFLIDNYSIGLYMDILVYGFVGASLYLVWTYFAFQKDIKK